MLLISSYHGFSLAMAASLLPELRFAIWWLRVREGLVSPVVCSTHSPIEKFRHHSYAIRGRGTFFIAGTGK